MNTCKPRVLIKKLKNILQDTTKFKMLLIKTFCDDLFELYDLLN